MTDISYRWQLRQLSRERAPTRDLWAGIAAAIAQPQRAQTQSPRSQGWRVAGSAIAASLVLGAFGLGLANPRLLETLHLRRQTPEHQLVLTEAAAIRKQYQTELRQFRATPIPEAITPALIELDQSADKILVALDSHPEAIFLLDQLRRTYARRLELTQRVAML
jgi:hypothetical protein